MTGEWTVTVKQLRVAMLTAVFFGVLASYGVYTFLKQVQAQEKPEGVTCYTGKFPALVPVR